MKVKCYSCDNILTFDDSMAGERAKCKWCKAEMEIPEIEEDDESVDDILIRRRRTNISHTVQLYFVLGAFLVFVVGMCAIAYNHYKKLAPVAQEIPQQQAPQIQIQRQQQDRFELITPSKTEEEAIVRLVIYCMIALSWFVFWTMMAVYTIRDAHNRSIDNGFFWGLIVWVLGLGSCFGGVLIVAMYLASRPTGSLIRCKYCGNKKLAFTVVCPHCKRKTRAMSSDGRAVL